MNLSLDICCGLQYLIEVHIKNKALLDDSLDSFSWLPHTMFNKIVQAQLFETSHHRVTIPISR